MDKLNDELHQLKDRFQLIKERLNIEQMRKQVRELEAKSMKEEFWDNSQQAQQVMQRLSQLQDEIKTIETMEGDLEDLLTLVNLATGDGMQNSELGDLTKETSRISEVIVKLEIKLFLNGQYDREGALLSIHAGQGGTEAMDWTAMLLRMYLKYAENRNWKVEMIDEIPGEEAGIKSATLAIHGTYAYGYLRYEKGTHRLVRLSPFNADNLRQTSFAKVEVLPQLPEDNQGTEIKQDEIEFEAFRASGHGGQNVNKVSTAVRIKHLPSGVVVTSQTQRTQEQNRKIAMNILKSKLWELKERQKQEKEKEIKGKNILPAWGSQIRSYILHPYKMVKDLRTKIESSNPEAVLNGDLDIFIESEIRTLG